MCNVYFAGFIYRSSLCVTSVIPYDTPIVLFLRQPFYLSFSKAVALVNFGVVLTVHIHQY